MIITISNISPYVIGACFPGNALKNVQCIIHCLVSSRPFFLHGKGIFLQRIQYVQYLFLCFLFAKTRGGFLVNQFYTIHFSSVLSHPIYLSAKGKKEKNRAMVGLLVYQGQKEDFFLLLHLVLRKERPGLISKGWTLTFIFSSTHANERKRREWICEGLSNVWRETYAEQREFIIHTCETY